MKKRKKEEKEEKLCLYGKVARYGDWRVRYRIPIIILSSADKAEKYFADRAKSLPGPMGLGGSFSKELHGPFPTEQEAREFFSSKGFDDPILEIAD